jgi:putative membrane protein
MRANGLSHGYMRLLVLGALLTTAACGGRDKEDATDTAGTPAAATGDTGAMGGAMGGDTAATAAAGPMNDANIVSLISMSNSEEIGDSKVAQTKSTNANVKAFANDMIRDHQTLQGQVDKLGTSANITPQEPTTASAEKQRMEQELTQLQNTAKGADFDRTYIEDQISDHQKTLDNLQRFQTEAQNAELKSLIEKTIPKVQQHLQRAKDIQGKMASA